MPEWILFFNFVPKFLIRLPDYLIPLIAVFLTNLLASARINKAAALASERTNNVIIWEKKIGAYQKILDNLLFICMASEDEGAFKRNRQGADDALNVIKESMIYRNWLMTNEAILVLEDYLKSSYPRNCQKDLKSIEKAFKEFSAEAKKDLKQYISFPLR